MNAMKHTDRGKFLTRGLHGLAVLVLFSAVLCFSGIGESLEQKKQPRQNLPPTKEIISISPAIKAKSALVTLDFEEADIQDVIKVLAMASGMNMVIGEGVQAKVTVALKDVHWERALDIILQNLIRIMTFEKVKQEERDIPLNTRIIYLNFADVAVLKDTLAGMLTDRGSIEVDARTNSMIISDIPARVENVAKVAQKLDTRTPQVLIEAMLVDVKLTDDDELGINWQILHADRHYSWQDKTSSDNYISQPASPMSALSSQSIKLGFLQRMGSFRLDGLIQAWAQDAKANILASPKIVTLDNQTAKIEIKSQAPYTKTSTGEEGGETSSTQFKDVITSLEVTPHITKEGFISMEIKPRQEFIEAYIGDDNEPQIGSRSAETNVLVEDGETIVLGGLRKVEDNATIVKVPVLGDIPILGNLFRKTDIQKINTELVMFVTPHIIVQPDLTDEDMDKYEMLDDARAGFLKEQQEERKKRLKKRKKQARRLEREKMKDTASLEEIEIPVPSMPAVKEEEIERGPEDGDYIYAW
jgi:type IV pilus assembly protein PilQ